METSEQMSRPTQHAAADLQHAISRASSRAIELRRALHRWPETGLDLPKTQARVAAELDALGIPYSTGEGLSSLVGLIRGGKAGHTVLLRADMDALPIQEHSDLPYASEIDGAMHACGHDIHTAGLLGAARVLNEWADSLHGSVVLMFQPGEEGHFGARQMIAEGVLDAPHPEVPAPSSAFAAHVNPWYPVGTVNSRPGPILAAADKFLIRMIGSTGHGSAPHASLDPIPAACELVGAIQTMVARTNPPFDPAVVSVTGFNGGDAEARSVIPECVTLTGTFRTHSAQRRKAVEDGLHRLAGGVATAHGLQAEVSIDPGYPSTINSRDVVEQARPSFDQWIPAGFRDLADPLMGSEDFSYVLQRVPGMLAFVGTTPAEELAEGWPEDNHSSKVRYTEDALEAFVRAHLAFVHAHLRPGWPV